MIFYGLCNAATVAVTGDLCGRYSGATRHALVALLDATGAVVLFYVEWLPDVADSEIGRNCYG